MFLRKPDVAFSLLEPETLDEASASGVVTLNIYDCHSRAFLFEPFFHLTVQSLANAFSA
jgi:hypothetical protein